MDLESARERPVAVGAGLVIGVDAVPVAVEVVMHGDASGPRILGSADRVVREAYHRVLDAFRAQGLPSPRGVPTVNFAPAGIPKTGAGFDLPLALALAGAGGAIPRTALEALAAHGEVTLDGRVLPAPGVVPIALAARERGWRRLLASPADARRAAAVPGIEAVAVDSLAAAIAVARGDVPAVAESPRSARAYLLECLLDGAGEERAFRPPDLDELCGLETQKRALAVAAAGRHDLLLVGPPGSGKTALARRLPTLLPAPGEEECLEILKIHSSRSDAVGSGLVRGRPVRAPHHSSSAASVLGGGSRPRPGEVTLAHRGVLFLDELPEFRREVLEGLRQPLEDRRITIGRAECTLTMPADFLLAAAMNPCPCGFEGDPRRPCTCPPAMRMRYRARVSGPLLDRFDLAVPVPAIDVASWDAPLDPALSTAALRSAIEAAVERQRERGCANGRLDGALLERAGAGDAAARRAIAAVVRRDRLAGRARVRILRVARTLADLADADRIGDEHVLEAARLRSGAFSALPAG